MNRVFLVYYATFLNFLHLVDTLTQKKYVMKKILLFSFILTLVFSCSLDNDSDQDDSYYDFVAIQSASFPDYFEFGKTYEITYDYFRPSTCHSYSDLYYLVEGNTRTIAVIAYVQTGDNCEPLVDESMEGSFDFRVEEQAGTYVFKFWQGEDDEGEDVFITYEVQVQ